ILEYESRPLNLLPNNVPIHRHIGTAPSQTFTEADSHRSRFKARRLGCEAKAIAILCQQVRKRREAIGPLGTATDLQGGGFVFSPIRPQVRRFCE
ncbi:MAG TPA: hypothetical protein VFQ43_02695, partial [Nitrososphaera sp.]|nr:hypothetical protein [Nitrososphaera sp.]